MLRELFLIINISMFILFFIMMFPCRLQPENNGHWDMVIKVWWLLRWGQCNGYRNRSSFKTIPPPQTRQWSHQLHYIWYERSVFCIDDYYAFYLRLSLFLNYFLWKKTVSMNLYGIHSKLAPSVLIYFSLIHVLALFHHPLSPLSYPLGSSLLYKPC
jgi:hypothetical protein